MSSRPIIRGLDQTRVQIQENGFSANGASELGEDHFVPVDPLTTNQVEVIRGPATLRLGTPAIGGVVEASNNRVPATLPCQPVAAAAGRPCTTFELRGGATTVDNGLDGAALLDAGGGNFAIHADAFGRRADDYRIPKYPYLNPPSPEEAPRVTQPNQFNGRQPNSSLTSNGQSVGGSYVYDGGYLGLAVTENNALYHIPGIDGENTNTRIDGHQTQLLSKGEWRAPVAFVDAVRFWGGITDYKHDELGLADPLDPASDGVRQTFTNKEQNARAEMQSAPFDLRFASMTTSIGVVGHHQDLTAPSPDNIGLWDPNSNTQVGSYIFNEFNFTDTTKVQVAGRIERVNLSGTARNFSAEGLISSTPASPGYTPMSGSIGLIHNLPWELVATLTAEHIERAPRPAELFSGGAHDATATFDKGNPNLRIEAAQTYEASLKRASGPFRFELNAYYTKFDGFIFRNLTGNTCDSDTNACGPGVGDPNLREALYSQRAATFRGGEFQSQWDVMPLWTGMFGVETQADLVRATFDDGTNVPRIPPVRVGGGVFYRDDNWLARINLLHAFAHTDIAVIGETPTPGYNDLRAEISYRWTAAHPRFDEISEFSVGLSGTNLLNDPIRNSVSYNKDQVLLPGASVRAFATVKY